MHILLIADGRSPITRRWVQGLFALKHEVTLISTFPCVALDGIRDLHVLPVAFAGMGGSQVKSSEKNAHTTFQLRKMVSRYRSIFQSGRSFIGPLTMAFYAEQYRRLVYAIKPDLVHALRIPFEGMLASHTPPEFPLVVSIWGNDLTLHGGSSRLMKKYTHKTLQRANGFVADVKRDQRLSRQWGFNSASPSIVVPTCGGINLVEIHRVRQENPESLAGKLPQDVPLIVNPRGLRPSYVRNDVFFQAIPLVLENVKDVCFVCPSMAGQDEAQRWVQRLGISDNITLLSYLSQPQLWELFYQAIISISLTIHDGTPNTLLEAMACGCFPIVGDIESLREWITPGVNGLLVRPDDPEALAEAVLLALQNQKLRSEAAELNLALIQQRGEVGLVRTQVEVFYQRVLAEFR